jgi:hypothetical protein
MKKTILPNRFVIEKLDSPYWRLFIKSLNDIVGREYFTGDAGKYYGIFYNVPIVSDEIPIDVELISLSMWAESTGIELEMTMCYDDIERPIVDCVQIHEYAPNYPGEMAPRTDCLFAYRNDGYALGGDVYSDYHGRTYIAELEEEAGLVYSHYHSDWLYEDSDYVFYGYTTSDSHQDWFYSDEYVEAGGEYYIDSSIAERHGYRWSERRDAWYHIDDYPESVEDANANYHSQSRRDYSNSSTFKIAFEIEKEDSSAGLIHYDQLHYNTGWCKEGDGSLDDDGYELISPIFDMYSNDLETAIGKSSDLETLINADYSDRCGGHINISCTTMSPNILFEGMSSFMPLLYAMYEDRVDKNYSKAKAKHQYHASGDKYSSVYIKPNLVEFRIFPAVKNVKNLLWRRDLIRIMVDNMNKSELDVLRMMLNKKSRLHNHLRIVFSEDKILQKAEAFVRYSEIYNYKKLPLPNKDKYKNQKDRKNPNDSTNSLGA